MSKVLEYERLERCGCVIDDHEMRLLMFILRHEGPKGFYWSPAAIANEIGRDERRVRRVLKHLGVRGFITVRYEGSGRAARCFRQVNFARIELSTVPHCKRRGVNRPPIQNKEKGVNRPPIRTKERGSIDPPYTPKKGVYWVK
jgi:hypothetical protein